MPIIPISQSLALGLLLHGLRLHVALSDANGLAANVIQSFCDNGLYPNTQKRLRNSLWVEWASRCVLSAHGRYTDTKMHKSRSRSKTGQHSLPRTPPHGSTQFRPRFQEPSKMLYLFKSFRLNNNGRRRPRRRQRERA